MSDGTIKGPRPLSLHFSNSQAIWDAVSKRGASVLKDDCWHSGVKKDVSYFRRQLVDETLLRAFDTLVRTKAEARKKQFLKGINGYLHRHYERPPSDAVACVEIGSVQLLDFGGQGQPILMIPSLINPPYILDLMPERSLAAHLKANGYRPLLVNWGTPGVEERTFGLSGYITERLEPLLDFACELAQGSVPVIGYCMGGTLSVALAARKVGKISKLVLLAAPWDFATKHSHAGRKFAPAMLKHLYTLPEGGTIGVDILQTFFTNVDPTLTDRKFRSYAAGKYAGAQADFFSAMEVWANNGPPLARKVAEECLKSWYSNNDTMLDRWKVAGEPVKASNIVCPVWVAAPEGDRLVPQASAFALLKQLQYGTAYAPPSGHIGMVVGNRAKAGLWGPLCDWLED